MKVIYKPKGAAAEYAELALNLFNGCEHGCKYCYAPACRFTPKEKYFTEQYIRKNVLKLLEADLQEMEENNDRRCVLLCFICDPYQKGEEYNKVTRKALELFKKYRIKFQILTKAGSKATRDFDLYKIGDKFASSLTFLDEAKSLEWEPKADVPRKRIEAIKEAKRRGIETWVSLEPVIETEETLKLIAETIDYVDCYKIGKINYWKGIEQDWEKFTNTVIDLLAARGKKYYIKDSLRPYIKGGRKWEL